MSTEIIPAIASSLLDLDSYIQAHLALPSQPFVHANNSGQRLLLLLSGIWNVDHSSGSVLLTGPRGGEEGRNWNSSSAQLLSYFPRWNWKCLSIERRVWIYWHSLAEHEHSAQNTANGRQHKCLANIQYSANAEAAYVYNPQGVKSCYLYTTLTPEYIQDHFKGRWQRA